MRRVVELASALESERFTRQRLADGSGVLLDLERMRVLTLNETAMFLLEEIAAGATTAAALAERLAAAFEVEPAIARRDVAELVDHLAHYLQPRQDGARPEP